MLIISFSHWLFIAKQCNILLEFCSHNSFSNMVVVLSIYCCRNLAFIRTSNTIFSVQINAYTSQIGDVVIVKDEHKPRNRWSLAQVVGTYPSKDGLVRSVKVRIGDPNLSGDGSRLHPPTELERPIQKLVLLLPQEERPGFPDGAPSRQK